MGVARMFDWQIRRLWRNFTDEEIALSKLDAYALADKWQEAKANGDQRAMLLLEHLLDQRLVKLQVKATWRAAWVGFLSAITGAVVGAIVAAVVSYLINHGAA